MEFRIRSQTIIIHKISNIQNKRQFTKHKKGRNHKITALEAEAGGFEPPVPLRVRQFSKLVVSATHPHFLVCSVLIPSNCVAKISRYF